MAAAIEPLDLVDIAVLLNYERATTEERFRNMKLREIAYPGQTLSSIRADDKSLPKDWNRNDRTLIVLDEVSTQEDRQLPATMLSKFNYVPTLTEQQLETIFHRIRAYDACGRVSILLEKFFALFSPDTKLRIRHAPKDKEPGISYITPACNRRVVEDVLIKPKFSTVLFSLQWNHMKFTGTESEMTHWYTEFCAPDSEGMTSILDLASMQFGDVGRGPGKNGKMLIVLDTKTDYEERLKRIADGVNLAKRRAYPIMFACEDASNDKIARKVKERWEKRDTEKWCGHCGAPEPKSKCGGCGNVWFCNREHQKMMWSFHKGYCNKG